MTGIMEEKNKFEKHKREQEAKWKESQENERDLQLKEKEAKQKEFSEWMQREKELVQQRTDEVHIFPYSSK